MKSEVHSSYSYFFGIELSKFLLLPPKNQPVVVFPSNHAVD